MKTRSLFLLFWLPIALTSAQNGETLVQAFSRSYQAEADSNYSRAIESLKPVYKEDSYESNIRLGWLYYLKGDHFQSKTYYGRAMKLLPYAVEPKLGYVLPLAALGNWEEVIQTYEAILKIDPRNALVHYRLGAIYYERKDYEKAYKYTEVVVNLYPFDYDSVVLFAWIHLQMGNKSKAKALFQKAILIQPEGYLAREGLKWTG